jgi:hypothetical protein
VHDIGAALNAHLAALAHHGYCFRVIGVGEPWLGWRGRMRAYATAARELAAMAGDGALALFIDAYDALPLRSPENITAAFSRAAAPADPESSRGAAHVVFGGETVCGHPAVCRPLPQSWWRAHLERGRPQPARQYVNGGMAIGRALEIARAYEWMLDGGFEDDQVGASAWLAAHVHEGALDVNENLFHTVDSGKRLPSEAALEGLGHYFEHFPWIVGDTPNARVYDELAKSTLRTARSGAAELAALRAAAGYSKAVWDSQ